MCGRYILTIVDERLKKLLGMELSLLGLSARYNIAPTQPVLVVRAGRGGCEAVHLRWGLVPSWAKDVSIGSRLINARSETAHQKPAFRYAFRRRRCLIPADGFYEWRRTMDAEQGGTNKKRGSPRQPYLITMADEQPFAMAGLWEHWQDEAGNELETCTILTTSANELVAELHDRMPVILQPEDFDAWLDSSDEGVTVARALCKPYPAELMMHRVVSAYVNNARHEGPDCARPSDEKRLKEPGAGPTGETPTLF